MPNQDMHHGRVGIRILKEPSTISCLIEERSKNEGMKGTCKKMNRSILEILISTSDLLFIGGMTAFAIQHTHVSRRIVSPPNVLATNFPFNFIRFGLFVHANIKSLKTVASERNEPGRDIISRDKKGIPMQQEKQIQLASAVLDCC